MRFRRVLRRASFSTSRIRFRARCSGGNNKECIQIVARRESNTCKKNETRIEQIVCEDVLSVGVRLVFLEIIRFG
jgi:hypothetical protein